ncbi:hypothetical protein D3C81_1595520 [compost metagenome]
MFGATKLTEPDDSPTPIVMLWPLARVTTSGEPVTGAETEAVYTTVPPSTTLGVAVRVTVDVSMLSLMVVTASRGLIDNCSKLPPVAPVMVALTVEPLL